MSSKSITLVALFSFFIAAFAVSVCIDMVGDNVIIPIRNTYFNAVVSFLLLIIILIFLVKKIELTIVYNWIDVLITIYFSFVILNYTSRGLPVDDNIITLLSLGIFYLLSKYFLLRTSPTSKKVVIVIFLLFGLLQGVLGVLQLLAITPTLNGLFRITGSFINPGPYSVYLISFLPLSLSIYLFSTEKAIVDYILKYVASANVFFSALILPQTESRTAWIAAAIGVAVVLVIKFKLIGSFLVWIRLLRNKFYVALALIFLLALCTVLYKLKEDSANGRLLIWKVAGNMVKDRPFLGTGYGGVKRDYNAFQAMYFEKNPNSYDEIRIANQVNYVFNDYLQILIEQGIIGLFIFLCVISVSLVNAFKLIFHCDELSLLDMSFVVGGTCSAILLMVTFLSTYSLETLPISINFMFCLALISSFSPNKFSVPSKKKLLQYSFAALGIIIALGCIIICTREIRTYRSFHEITAISNIDKLKIFKKNYQVLKNEPSCMLQYGKLLASQNDHKESISVLTATSKFLCDTSLYRSLGDSYRTLGNHKQAQLSYLKSAHIAPHRFLPRYYLVKSYLESGDTTNALAMADYIVRLPVKIEAPIVYQIKDEMKELISNSKAITNVN